MITLSKEQVKRLHSKLLEATGGLNGIRDEDLLDSVLQNPFQTFGGAELYPSTVAKIARTAYGFVCNHPFADGNKRVGMYVMLALLELNHIETDFTDDDVVYVGLSLANGEIDDKQLLDMILERSRYIHTNYGAFSLRNATPEDLPKILALQREAYQSEAAIYDDYSIQPLTQSLGELAQEYERGVILKAVLNGEIIGSVRAYSNDNTAYIGKLIVKPSHQNKGLGRQLIQEIESKFPGKRYELFTGSKSEKNIALYKKCGYTRFSDRTAAPGLTLVYLEKTDSR